VAHAYNPRYSQGRDQEDHSLKRDPISKKTSQKRAGGVAQGVGPECKPQYSKKKKKKNHLHQLPATKI
jgi:hypothetical protein